MESDASFPILSPLMDVYPDQAGAIYNTYADLALSQQWRDIRIHDLAPAGFGVFFAHKATDDPIRLILPLPFHAQSLTPLSLRKIFSTLSTLEVIDLGDIIANPLGPAKVPSSTVEGDDQEDNRAGDVELDRETIYVSIATTDSSTVYYKLTKGIKKPTDVPDE